MSDRTRWYTARELAEISDLVENVFHGPAVDPAELVDDLGHGRRASGGYGCNIADKLRQRHVTPHVADHVLALVRSGAYA